MGHLYIILILCYISNSQATTCEVLREGGDGCIFSNVRTNETNPYFYPTAENATEVEVVDFDFDSNVIPILTDELCKAFPNLKELRMFHVHLRTIQPNALHECTKLTAALFGLNNLETLDPNLFEKSPEIETISIHKNNFKAIDSNVFIPVKKLKNLVIGENYLTHFPIEQFPVIESLELLYLIGNDLTDLNEQELLYKFPNLKTIDLRNNRFDCERLRVILNFFKRKGVKLEEESQNVINRNIGLLTIDNVECLPARNNSDSGSL